MIVGNFISNDIPTVSPKDKANRVMEMMEEFKVSHLPVVEGNVYLGIIAEDVLLSLDDETVSVSKLELKPGHLNPDQHIYEFVSLSKEHQLTIVPIVDNEMNYLGLMGLQDLVNALASSQAVIDDGSIIVLEMTQNDYSLANISRIVESNDIKIVSAVLTTSETSSQVEVTLKLNKKEISGLMQSFNRYDYKVKAYFRAPEYSDDLKDRYDGLMRYLNM